MKKKLLIWLLIVLQTAALIFPVMAERTGSLTMNLPSDVVDKYKDQTVQMSIYKIAERYVDAENGVSWGIVDKYAGLEPQIKQIMDDLSKKIARIVLRKRTPWPKKKVLRSSFPSRDTTI